MQAASVAVKQKTHSGSHTSHLVTSNLIAATDDSEYQTDSSVGVILIVVFLSLLLLVIAGLIFMYFCYWQTASPGEGVSKRESKASSGASNAEKAMDENADGNIDVGEGGCEEGDGNDEQGSISQRGSEQQIQPQNGSSSKKQSGRASSKGKGKKSFGPSRGKNQRPSRRRNVSVGTSKVKCKKKSVKKRNGKSAGKGGSLNKVASRPKEAQGEQTMLYNEGFQYYKQFLKSVNSVKSVSQYFNKRAK